MAFVVCSVILWCCPVGRDLARLSRCHREQVASLRTSQKPHPDRVLLRIPAVSWMWGMGHRHRWDRFPALPSGMEKALGHPSSWEDACG